MNAPRDNLPAALPAGERAAGAAAGPRCVSIDLEVGKNDGRIHQFAAVRGNDGQTLLHAHGDLPQALARLDDFTDGCAFLLGHNLLAFDLPHLAHRAFATLSADDALALRHAGERYELLDASGCVVGRMAQAFTAPAGMRCIAVRVHALLVRRRVDADAAYRASLRCEEWELVLPELVFEPELSGSATPWHGA